MQVTAISVQVKNPNRVNISVDGKYRLSLDIAQVVELGLRNGMEVASDDMAKWEEESQFGKLYARALEYCLMRPHSAREVRDYLWKKTLHTKYKTRQGDIKERDGVSQSITERVFERLVEKGYIDDEKFARYWLENRNLTKGSSRKKLIMELRGKGVEQGIIETALPSSARSDADELAKVIAKKRARYPDTQKFTQYLLRQGFRYDDIQAALAEPAD